MKRLLNEISKCKKCQKSLPLAPRPILSAHVKSKIIIISQAPGIVAHNKGIPWDDKGGENLRKWLGVDLETFYKVKNFAILPMGFCYPGKGKSGDLPPQKECAPLWHEKVLVKIQNPKLILLVGKHAQDYYLKQNKRKNLTETVQNFKEHLPKFFVLPHPSPRNNIWMKKNQWFVHEVLPELKKMIRELI